MPSIKKCPKEMLTQPHSDYVKLPSVTNADISDNETFPIPLSQALIEDLPTDIKDAVCYTSGLDAELDLYEQPFPSFDGYQKSYYIKMEKYGDCINAISAAGKAFVNGLNNNRPLLEVESKYFGLNGDEVSKTELPDVITADERDKFSVVREPWSERLAKQITLLVGRDMLRREEGSPNYYLRHNDEDRLSRAQEEIVKVIGRMKEGREDEETLNAFIYATFTEFNAILEDISKEHAQNTSQLVEVKNEFLGLSDKALETTELPPLIKPDEREAFAVIHEPWGEKLARQMTLVIGPNMLRREEGSFNYFVRKNKEGLKSAMEKLSKTAGLMTARGEMKDKVEAFEDAAYWELSNVVTEIDKKEERERLAMGELERLFAINNPLNFAKNLAFYAIGLATLTYAFGFFGVYGHSHAEWVRSRRSRRTGGNEPIMGEAETALLREALEGGTIRDTLAAVRAGLVNFDEASKGDAHRLSDARKGLQAAEKALEAIERARKSALQAAEMAQKR